MQAHSLHVCAIPCLATLCLRKNVRLANLMTSRTLSLVTLADLLFIGWLLEQPTSSLMERYPRFRWKLRQARRIWVGTFRMIDFGAPTTKPLRLAALGWHRQQCHVLSGFSALPSGRSW